MHPKLSASGLSTFLRSPKSYYWRYKAGLEPSQPQVATFDHDKLLGVIWAQYTDRFYRGVDEAANAKQAMDAWLSGSEGWVPEKARVRLTTALENLMPQYYQHFSPGDGCRAEHQIECSKGTPAGDQTMPCDCNGPQSELWLENDRFRGRLDGLSAENVVHEVKTTSRSPQVTEQLWKIGHSIQVKLYCVLADADGYCIELAFKDPPHAILRAPIVRVTADQKREWSQELHALADRIESLGDDPNNYPCHSEGCCMTTKGMVSMCGYRDLCDGASDEVKDLLYKKREYK